MWICNKRSFAADVERIYGSCKGELPRREGRGVGLWAHLKLRSLSWQAILRRCSPMTGGSASAAEVHGSGMLLRHLHGWLKRLGQPNSFFGGSTGKAPAH